MSLKTDEARIVPFLDGVLPHKTPPWFDLMVWLGLALVVLGYGWLYRHFAQDDAFITYRYARNLAQGHGFVYNLHEPVLGTTTPLYTLLLALLGRFISLDLRLVSHVISLLSLWGSGLLLYRLGRPTNPWLAAATALLFVTNPLLISAIGMETFWLLLLLLLTIQSYLAGQFARAGLLLGLLILTRYELAILALILGLHFIWQQRRLPWWGLWAAGPVAMWLAFAAFTFGNVIPNSAQAKLIDEEGFGFAVGALIWWAVYAQQSTGYYGVLLLCGLGGFVVARHRRSLPPGYALLLLWSATYFIIASLLAGAFPWYYGPLMPGLAILLSWGSGWLAARLTPRLAPALLAGLIAGLVGLHMFSAATGWTSYQGRIMDAREPLYGEVMDWLAQHAPEQESLAIGEIGLVGYYSNRYIVDLRGLVTPALLPSLGQGRAETLRQTIECYQPDYLLTNEPPIIETITDFPEYKPVQTFNRSYILYQRQS